MYRMRTSVDMRLRFTKMFRLNLLALEPAIVVREGPWQQGRLYLPSKPDTTIMQTIAMMVKIDLSRDGSPFCVCPFTPSCIEARPCKGAALATNECIKSTQTSDVISGKSPEIQGRRVNRAVRAGASKRSDNDGDSTGTSATLIEPSFST